MRHLWQQRRQVTLCSFFVVWIIISTFDLNSAVLIIFCYSGVVVVSVDLLHHGGTGLSPWASSATFCYFCYLFIYFADKDKFQNALVVSGLATFTALVMSQAIWAAISTHKKIQVCILGMSLRQ